ncbi:MAG: LptF/LptG family permease [Phycisphaerales bacterium]
MSILDRYIARQFLINVVVLFAILFSFVVVIDVSLNFERFARVAAQLATQHEGEAPGFLRRSIATVLVIVNLWWPRLLQLFNFLLGMVMVAAMGFTCSQMNRHREFLAMLAAGVSLKRIARPVLLTAVALTSLQLLNQELVIPRIAPLLTRDHGDAGKVTLGSSESPLAADGEGRVFRAASFDADREVLTGVFVLERDEHGAAVRAISADSAAWRDGGWDLTGGWATPRGSRDRTQDPPGPVDRIETSLGPTELKMNRFQSYRQSLSFAQAGR